LAGGVLVSLRGELQAKLICGSQMAPGDIALTIDDFPPASAPNGVNNADTVRQDLAANGATATAFVIGCNFQNTPFLGYSPVCRGGFGTESASLMQRWAGNGFILGNHSFRHEAYTLLNDYDVLVDLKLNQSLVSPYQADGIRLFRFPYLMGGPREVAAMLKNTDLSTNVLLGISHINLNTVDLSQVRGPLDTDMGAELTKPDGTLLMDAQGNGGGDWQCYKLGLAPADCVNLYLNSVTASGVMLTHIGGDTMPGGANQWSVLFHKRLLQGLIAKDYRLVPVDAIPGLLGDVQATGPKMISHRFGSGDGQGPVVFGDLDGDGRQDVCKAFGKNVDCMLNAAATNKDLEFRAPHSWFQVDDPTWVSTYKRQFMLVDWD